jgi:hypothetical protein
MTEKTILVPGLVLNYEGEFSMKSIEAVIKKYMSTTHYTLEDVSHDLSVAEDYKDETVSYLYTAVPQEQDLCKLSIKCECTSIKPLLKKTPYGEVMTTTGKVKITFRATTYGNWGEHKQTEPIWFFIWEMIARFIWSGGHHQMGLEMKRYCYQLYDEIYGLLYAKQLAEAKHA